MFYFTCNHGPNVNSRRKQNNVTVTHNVRQEGLKLEAEGRRQRAGRGSWGEGSEPWGGAASQGSAGAQGSFPAGTPGNGVPKVILTVGTAPALGELYKKHPVCIKIRLFEIQNRNFFWGGAHNLPPIC